MADNKTKWNVFRFSCFIGLINNVEGCCHHLYNNETGSCYKPFDNTTDWLAAKHICQSLGADLAIIRTESDRQFLKSQSIEGWIGVNDRTVEGSYRDNDGIGMLSTEMNWKNSEPNMHSSNKEDCVRVDQDNYLSDEDCGLPFKFICEWSVRTEHDGNQIDLQVLNDDVMCDDHILKSIQVDSYLQCAVHCLHEKRCLAISFFTPNCLHGKRCLSITFSTSNCLLYEHYLGSNEGMAKSVPMFRVK